MNSKLLSTMAVVLTLLLTSTGRAPAQSSYFGAITNLNAAGYWPMHEIEPAAQGDIETNYGSLGALGNAYYPDYQVNSGAFIRQSAGALANDPDPAVFFTGPAGGGTATNGLFVPHISPLASVKAPFTLECWFMATNIGAGQGDILSEADGTKSQGFRIYYQNNGTNYPAVGVTGIFYDHAHSGSPLQINWGGGVSNAWHHLVLTCDASSNMTTYLDGAATPSGISGGNPKSFVGRYDYDAHQPFTLGTGLGNARAWHGLTDEVAVYTNVITDIAQHYNDALYGGAGAYFQDVTNDNPVIYLRMDSMPYTAPAIGSWPALTNYGQTNGIAVTNGVYTPGAAPGQVAGGAYGYFPVGLSGADVAQLSGVSSFADAGSAPAYNPTGTTPFTVAALFRGNPTDTNRVQSIVGHGTNSWELGLTVGGSIVFNSGTNSAAVVATGSGTGDLVSTTTAYDDGNWHQVVAVHNNTTNVLYVDGLPNNTNVVAANNVGNSYDVMIGSDPCYTNTPIGLGRQFAGLICDVAFFTNALSAAQAQNLYNASGVLPTITKQPVSATLNAGVAFTNTVAITAASAPISFQWFTNGVAIGGATNASLILNPVVPGNASTNYYVVITNNFVALTSSVVSLTVYGTPILTSQFPAAYTNPVTLYGGTSPATRGSTPTFSISVLGPQPIYQWMTNGAAVGGATNASFTFTNCQMTSPTHFECVVTNVYGAATSMVWTASYVPAPTAPFPQAVLTAGPVTYWRLNEPDDGLSDGNPGAICNDYQSANNGKYTNVYLGNFLGGTGYSPDTDPTEKAAQFGAYPALGSSGCFAGSIGTNINFSAPSGSNAEFSVAVWANGNLNGQSANAGLMAKGYFFGEEFVLDEGAPGTALRFEVRSAAGTAYNANSSFLLSSDANWHFVVGVCDQANSNLSLWIDGVQVTNITIPPGSGITNSAAVPLMIGARSSTAGAPGNNQFAGFLNEAAVYNYPLSSNLIVHQFQVTGIAPFFTTEPPASTNVDSGGTLIIPAGALGTPVISYRWFDVNANTNIPGQTNATLVISNLTASDSYYATATNAYGGTNSTTVTVSVISGIPQLYADVQNPFYGVEGHSTSNSVEAFGTAPLAYQWQFLDGATWTNLTDNGRIGGSQSSALTIASVYPSDAGNYQAVVSNGSGSITSSVATLIVAGLPLNFYGNGLLWTANGGALLNNNLLTLTDPSRSASSGSFFFQDTEYIGAFQAAFTYQAQSAGNGLADGITFCLQRDPRGPAALASAGDGLGVGNGGVITPSAELMLDIYGGSGFAFGTNGVNIPTSGATSPNFHAPGSVQFTNGDPINVTVTYADGEMALTFADPIANTSFSTNLNVGDLTSILGADTAYVGFTGGYGGQSSLQTITNFSFVSLATLGLQLNNGTSSLISWPEDVVGYVLQENPNLATTNWMDVTNLANVTNSQNQVVLPLVKTNAFYRLKLVE